MNDWRDIQLEKLLRLCTSCVLTETNRYIKHRTPTVAECCYHLHSSHYRLMTSVIWQVNTKTHGQCGAAAVVVFTTQPLVFLIGGTVGHERPLDHTLWGLGERKSPCDLEHTYSRRMSINHTFRLYKWLFIRGAMWDFCILDFQPLNCHYLRKSSFCLLRQTTCCSLLISNKWNSADRTFWQRTTWTRHYMNRATIVKKTKIRQGHNNNHHN